RIDVVQNNIDFSVVEEVSERRSARRDDRREPASGCRRNFFEPRSIEISKELRPLRPSRAPIQRISNWVNLAIRHKQIEQAVVVEIEESDAPSEKRNCGPNKSGLCGSIGESNSTIVAE